MSLELNKLIEEKTWEITRNVSLIDELRRRTLPKLKFVVKYRVSPVEYKTKYCDDVTYREFLSRLGFRKIDIDVGLTLIETIHKIEEKLGLDRGSLGALENFLYDYASFLYNWYCSVNYDGYSGWRSIENYYKVWEVVRSEFPTYNDLRDWIISMIVRIISDYLKIRTFVDKYGIIEPFKRYVYYKIKEYDFEKIIYNLPKFVQELEKYKNIFRNMRINKIEVKARKVTLAEVIEFANMLYDKVGNLFEYSKMYGFSSKIVSEISDGKYIIESWIKFGGRDVSDKYVTFHYEYYRTYPDEFREVIFGIFKIVREIVNARHKIQRLEELYNVVKSKVTLEEQHDNISNRQLTFIRDVLEMRGPNNDIEKMYFNIIDQINRRENMIIEFLRKSYKNVIKEIIEKYKPQRGEPVVYRLKTNEWKYFDIVDGIKKIYLKEVYMSVGETNNIIIQLVYDNDVHNIRIGPKDFSLYYVDILLNYPFEVEKVKIPTIPGYEEIIDRIL